MLKSYLNESSPKMFAPEGRLVKLNTFEVVQKCKSSRSRTEKLVDKSENV